MTLQNLVAEFQTAFQQKNDPQMQITLVREEFLELQEALSENDVFDIAKELADLLYVTYGLAEMLGINADTVVRDVHVSNMSKLDDRGEPIFREDGKILKGPRYWPPIPKKEWFYVQDVQNRAIVGEGAASTGVAGGDSQVFSEEDM